MKKLPVWYWLAIAYLCATVTYNIVLQWRYLSALQWDLIANLGFKVAAIALLLLRRAEGVYLLAAAFLMGLSYTLYDFSRFGTWEWLGPLEKFSRVEGFAVSFAIIVYMAVLARQGTLTGLFFGSGKDRRDRDRSPGDSFS